VILNSSITSFRLRALDGGIVLTDPRCLLSNVTTTIKATHPKTLRPESITRLIEIVAISEPGRCTLPVKAISPGVQKYSKIPK